MKKAAFLFCMIFLPIIAHLQSTHKYLNINNVNARINTKGLLFFDFPNCVPAYEFPKNSKINSAGISSIWISALDSTGKYYAAAATSTPMGDYYPGPINDSAGVLLTETSKWNRVWKISATDILQFLNTPTHAINNTPIDILEWPGKGNPYFASNNSAYLKQNELAPFVDVNNDNVYNALDGDYPLLSGEQMTWQVFNDLAGPKTITASDAMNIQIEQTSFACTGAPFDNVTFHSFKLINKSHYRYQLARLGLYASCQLGSPMNDYLGFSLPHRCLIVYNGDSFDDPKGYGSTHTQTGFMLIKQPSDINSVFTPGCMLHFQKNLTMCNLPGSTQGFYNSMRAIWQNGAHLKKICDQNAASATTADINFLYTDDPSNIGGFSEKTCGGFKPYKNTIYTSNDFTWYPGQVVYYTIAVMNTGLGSDNSNFYAISALADSVYNYFPACAQFANVLQTNIINPNNNIHTFPNPGKDFVRIDNSTKTSYDLTVIDASGKLIFSSQQIKDESYVLQTNNWSKGMYFVHIRSTSGYITQKLLLE